jgi:hypothetical protein
MQVTIGSQDLKANHNISQIVEVIEEAEKYPRALKVSVALLGTSYRYLPSTMVMIADMLESVT